ncbi:hypothetical protein [Kitasatospora sp. MAP12-9]|uniref:hypothetical protein n=1 Tax=Kitasatospora sp. MAP12-9 TaxID=3035100 RepID=UPI003D24BB08
MAPTTAQAREITDTLDHLDTDLLTTDPTPSGTASSSSPASPWPNSCPAAGPCTKAPHSPRTTSWPTAPQPPTPCRHWSCAPRSSPSSACTTYGDPAPRAPPHWTGCRRGSWVR